VESSKTSSHGHTSESCYLYVSDSDPSGPTASNVFYEAESESLAASLCSLFDKEYGRDQAFGIFHMFYYKAADLITPENRVLLDETLDLLRIYAEPDPGLYSAEPTRDTLLRAQYAIRAEGWEDALRRQAEDESPIKTAKSRELAGRAQRGPTGVVSAKPTKRKRSTARGEGRAKLVSAFTAHHEYENGSCENLEPIGNNELARKADVAKATAAEFFKVEFCDHAKYRAACADITRLVASLKLLNGEFSPHHLYGARPPGEDDREDE
jgi:hypothetical protein